MTIAETAKLLRTMDLYFPNVITKRSDEEKYEMAEAWHRVLEKYDNQLMQNALDIHISESKKFPNIADLLDCYQEAKRISKEPKLEWFDFYEEDTGRTIQMQRVVEEK